jgi:hypothetical protein
MDYAKSTLKDNSLAVPKKPCQQPDHKHYAQIPDLYSARLTEQCEKLLGRKPDIIPSLKPVKIPPNKLIMTAHDIHQPATNVPQLGAPSAGWMPKDMIMTIVRQVAEAKKMQRVVDENASI